MYHLAKSLYMYATSKEEYSVLLLGLDNAGKTTLLNRIKSYYLPPNSSNTNIKESGTGATNADTNVGKTVPTIGQNVSTITLPDMYLKIWDVGGQLSMRGLWQSYYSSCHAIIFVVDSSDLGDDPDITKLPSYQRRLSNLPSTTSTTNETANSNFDNPPPTPSFLIAPTAGRLDECARVLESVLHHADAVGVPLLVLANKQDREDCVEVVRIKEGLVRKVFEGEKGSAVRDSRVLPVSALKGTGVKEAVEWVRTRVKWNKEGRPPVMR